MGRPEFGRHFLALEYNATSIAEGCKLGLKFFHWHARQSVKPSSYDQLKEILYQNRSFVPVSQLDYGDHGLENAYAKILDAIKSGRRIALYADYDVDGTMSCVAWLWFLKSIGHTNHVFYIPDRFKEGYGVNLNAIKALVLEEKAELIITMDTGITANIEAAWCKENGVDFICTDHHKIQLDKMPDCIILNPKLHPDPAYGDLCGCGITFVLLRKLGRVLPVDPKIWQDLLAITGIATICDLVPLNPINHKLARMGVEAISRSERSVLKKILEAVKSTESADEKDVGFRIGPRINAVGRMEHAKIVIEAFLSDEPSQLIKYMGACNEKRKSIQSMIVESATKKAKLSGDESILFLGDGDWHQGVVGIAASRIAEDFWRPTWLFQKGAEICKGSARSIAGFDVTDAMASCGELFTKFGGHRAAGGFSFPNHQEENIRRALLSFADQFREVNPHLWQSSVEYDCKLTWPLLSVELLNILSSLRPFGNGFEEPRFLISGKLLSVTHYRDKSTGQPKHTAMVIGEGSGTQKIVFFNRVLEDLPIGQDMECIVVADRNLWNGQVSLQLLGLDLRV
jgi:single-stranded-DNA-specific exonuclease